MRLPGGVQGGLVLAVFGQVAGIVVQRKRPVGLETLGVGLGQALVGFNRFPGKVQGFIRHAVVVQCDRQLHQCRRIVRQGLRFGRVELLLLKTPSR